MISHLKVKKKCRNDAFFLRPNVGWCVKLTAHFVRSAFGLCSDSVWTATDIVPLGYDILADVYSSSMRHPLYYRGGLAMLA